MKKKSKRPEKLIVRLNSNEFVISEMVAILSFRKKNKHN